MSTETDQRPDLRLVEPGDHERFAHYFWHPEPGRADAIVMTARVEGLPITALCGKQWIPQRDPSRFPVCPECIEIKRQAQGGP